MKPNEDVKSQDEKSSSPFIHILEDFINIDFVLYLLSYRLKNIRNRSCLVQRHPVKIENRVNIHSYKLNILQGCSSWFLEFFWNRKVNRKQHLFGGLGQPVSIINYKRTWSRINWPTKKNCLPFNSRTFRKNGNNSDFNLLKHFQS